MRSRLGKKGLIRARKWDLGRLIPPSQILINAAANDTVQDEARPKNPPAGFGHDGVLSSLAIAI